MVTLSPSTLRADKLSQVTIEEVFPLETDLNSATRKEFERKISELDELDLKSRPRLQEIWRASLHIPDLCFSELATLILDDCQFLSDTVLPFLLLPLLPKLKTLKVRNCDYVKVIFDVEGTTEDKLITLPLKKLTLSNLSNLENIWSEDPHGILNMHHLQQLQVTKCKDLTSVFPPSIAKDLVQLENLVVEDCEGLMAIVAEIISKEGEESDEDVEIIFEQLQHLYLEKLDELKCFYAGNYTLSFPSLEEVHVINCNSMKTFSAFNKINNPWYYSEYARPRKESDLNSVLHRNFEEVMIT